MPVLPLLVTASAIAAIALCLLYFKRIGIRGLDVSWIYYPNTVVVYGLWVGSILTFMVCSFKKSRPFPDRIPQTRFLCLVPAYNEAAVIRNSVESLLRQNYPNALVEIVVVFDGTDGTGEAARGLGVRVIETPAPGSGKHVGLARAFDRLLGTDDGRYVCVFDADNVVDSEFLRTMNNAILATGSRCLQGYHDVLNKRVNWVTKAMWCGTAASSRLYNQGRYSGIGNALICGTGWCCQGSLVKRHWPTIRTQTEDIELNGLLLLGEGVRVAWVPEARFYDEKPNNLWVAVGQRRRWMTGHLRVFRYLGWRCLRESFRRKDIALFEIFLYYAVPIAMSIAVVQFFGVLTGISLGVLSVSGPLATGEAQFTLGAITVGYIMGYQIIGFTLENRQWPRGVLYSFYTVVFSAVVWTMALVWAWFSMNRSDWMSHTPHVARAVSGPAIDANLPVTVKGRT
ncbi:MAG: glycosyltransferase family 2 protein [Candidatus Krumholzibacteriia bacterium]